MIRESLQDVGQLSLAGSQWKVDQADQASRLQNIDNLEKGGEEMEVPSPADSIPADKMLDKPREVKKAQRW